MAFNLTNFLTKLICRWGMLFRFLFITSVGIIGWFWVDPQPIADIPLSQLTLKLIFKTPVALGIVCFCCKWFFSFPDLEEEYDFYSMWATFSGYLIAFVTIWIWLA